MPEVQLILCEPFILPSGGVKENYEIWIAEINKVQEIIETAAKAFEIPLVKLQSVFDKALEKANEEYWIWDGIHPTIAGHYLIAKEWLNHIELSI